MPETKATENRKAALGTFEAATQCSDHRDDSIPQSDLGDVLYYGDNNADEFESVAVFRSVDTQSIIVACESSDYTGHGCQCAGRAERFDSLDDALRLGLSDDEARLCDATADRQAALAQFESDN